MTEATSAPLVSVRGEATIETDPEIAKLVVVVASRDRDRRKALTQLADRNTACLELVRGYGDAVENVESGSFTVVPELRDGRGERVKTYRGFVRINVTITEFAVLGELAARLSDQELISVEGPSWQLRRDSDVYRRARREAASAAVTRARDYAEALGGRLTGVVELADVGLSTDRRPRGEATASGLAMPMAPGVAYGSARGGAEPEPELDLEPETQVVSARVEARFTMSQPDDLNA